VSGSLMRTEMFLMSRVGNKLLLSRFGDRPRFRRLGKLMCYFSTLQHTLAPYSSRHGHQGCECGRLWLLLLLTDIIGAD
jgi:hypothetical protein